MNALAKRTLFAAIIAVHVLLLLKIWYDWRFSYFFLDDFNNLYWILRVDGPGMLWHVVNPMSDFYRPVGMSVYWLMWHTFGLNAVPYHALTWTLHVCNVILLFVLLLRITGSRFGASVGALLFGMRANFADIYWNFGFIFELLSCLFMFLALLIHTRERRTYTGAIAVLLLYVLAIKSKEMAITLPAMLLVYDLTQNRRFDRKSLFQYVALGAIGLWFAYLKVSTMVGTTVNDPYYMDMRVLTLGRGLGWYFDRLYDMRLRWGAWVSLSVLGLLWMLYKKEKRGIFFLAYIFISLMPLVFLVNHRGEFYWYIPFFGFAGIVTVIMDALSRRVQERMPSAAAPLGLAVFLTLSWLHYSSETRKSVELIRWRRGISEEYAEFMGQLSALPPPAAGEAFYFRTIPRNFSQEALTSAAEVALHRTGIKVEVLNAFPPSCRYCLEYDDSTRKLRIVP